jgi:uncharacterized protein YndB with AHSA1/START domain
VTDLAAAPTELVITRVFGAPRALVWKAWSDPKHVKHWWGPAGFSNSSCEMDFRVGGRFQLQMCAPDGTAYPCTGTFREIVEPERIVFAGEAEEGHPCGAGLPPRALVTVSFAERDGRTTLTLHTRFESVERREAALAAGYGASWAACLERLAEFIG